MICFQGGFGKFGGGNEGGRWSGGLKTVETRDIHTSIHAQTAVLSSFWPLLSCFGAFSGCLAPPEAYYEVLEHGVALRGRLDVVWVLDCAVYIV